MVISAAATTATNLKKQDVVDWVGQRYCRDMTTMTADEQLAMTLAYVEQIPRVAALPSAARTDAAPKIRIQVGIVTHRHGTNVYTGRTEGELEAKLAGYCREWWKEIADDRDPDDLDDSELIDAYFDYFSERGGEETLDLGVDTIEDAPQAPEGGESTARMARHAGFTQAITSALHFVDRSEHYGGISNVAGHIRGLTPPTVHQDDWLVAITALLPADESRRKLAVDLLRTVFTPMRGEYQVIYQNTIEKTSSSGERSAAEAAQEAADTIADEGSLGRIFDVIDAGKVDGAVCSVDLDNLDDDDEPEAGDASPGPKG